ATAIGTSAIAHNRGPRDNDKHIYGFKGANVDRVLSRRKKHAERRLEPAEREQVRKPRPPLRLRTDLTGAGAAGRVVQVRDLEGTGRVRVGRLGGGGGGWPRAGGWGSREVRAGEPRLVCGANGAGKTTLLGVLSGRVPATSGSVSVAAR